MDDDRMLLARYANGEEAAFSAFVGRHINLVYSSALRRVGGDRHLAEDIAQQVFFAAAQSAGKLARHPAISGWLFTATRNAAAQAVRGERRRRTREREALTMENDGLPSASVDWGSLRDVLETALDQLNSLDRGAILMRYIEQRGFAEIGRCLNTSEDGARMRVGRAMEKLRAGLAQRGITSSAAALATAIGANAAGQAPAALTGQISSAVVAAVKLSTVASAWSGATSLTAGKLLTWSAAVVAVAAVAFWAASTQSRRGESTLATASAAHRPTLAGRDQPQRPLALAQTRAAEADAGPVGSAHEAGERSVADLASADSSTRRPSPEEAKRILDEITHALHTDAELIRLRLELLRGEIPLRCAPLYQALKLSPVQIAEVERLLVARAAGSFQLMAEKFLRRLQDNEPKYAELKLQHELKTTRPIEGELRAILGEAGFAQLESLGSTPEGQPSLNSLVAVFAFTDAPLTPQQAIEASRILAVARAAEEKSAISISSAGGAWDSALPELQRILRPAQMAWIERMRLNEALRRQIALRRSKLRSQILDAAAQPR